MNRFIREPVNGFTHLIGAVFAFVGLLMLVIKAAYNEASAITIMAVLIFGISMVLLYSASATYHMVIARDKAIAFLRKIDHSMIFLLIAGTYTPFCLITLKGVTGWVLFGISMGVAVLGICFKLIWFHAPRWVSTGLYLGMGWMVVFVFAPLASKIATPGLVLLIAGGISYTLGGVIYGLKPNWIRTKNWGFHEIFHLFVMVGTLLHFLSIYIYVI